MKQVIKRVFDDLILEQIVPIITTRSNPYDEDYSEPMDNILGHIAGDEMGFAHWIDMGYKDKPDQISTLFWIYVGEKEDFKKLCEDLKIECVEEPICVKCRRVVYGVHSWDNGVVCDNCSR